MSRRIPANGFFPTRRRFLAGLLATALPAVPACLDIDIPLWKPPPAPLETYKVDRQRNVAYYQGPDASDYHRLDVYRPRGLSNSPVVLIVHGGAWTLGDKHCWGLYASIGEFFARQGITAVLPNYRLSPEVRHSEHIKDVARALEWTRQKIAGHGGCPEQIFLVGHSAGGHLICLLATHPDYAQEVAGIRGVIAVSGVYQIACGPVDVRLGGRTPNAFRIGQVVPVRADCAVPLWLRCPLPGLPMPIDIYSRPFGDDPRVRRDASPIEHVRPGLPPFLLVNAQDDLPTLPEMADDFHAALVAQGVECEQLRIAGRNHSSAFLRAIDPADPLAFAMLAFIRRHAAG